MFRNIITTCVLVTILFLAKNYCQSKSDGTVTNEMLTRFTESIKLDGYTKGMMNAISNNDINTLALDRANLGKTDHLFDHVIKTPSITNQKATGRCWLFTALNVMRPKVVKVYNLKDFEFSQNYLFFYDQLEKANLFLEEIIATREKPINDREVEYYFKHAIADGGVWNMMVDLVEKYGMVPKEVMPETKHSENTGSMNAYIGRKLKEHGLRLRQMSDKSTPI